MDRPTCPKCRKPGVQERISKRTGRPYLANVETYDSGISYFRGLHTREECAAYVAEFEARVAESIAREEEGRRLQEQGIRAHALTTRYKAIYGEQAVRDNWDRIAVRWFGHMAAVTA